MAFSTLAQTTTYRLGNRGTDTLYGDNGIDVLIGGDGADTLYGGNDDDLLVGDNVNSNAADTIFAKWATSREFEYAQRLVESDSQNDSIIDDSGSNQTIENVEKTEFADGSQIAFLNVWGGHENVLLDITNDGRVSLIEDNVVSWQCNDAGNVWFFRWRYGEQDNALLHWSADDGKSLIDVGVDSWDATSEGVFYFQSLSDGRENVLRHWSQETGSVMVEDNIVDWKVGSDGDIYFFRWESAGRPRTLLHWSVTGGKTIIDDNVQSWEVTADAVFYVTDPADELDAIERTWMSESS